MKTERTREDLLRSEREYARAYDETRKLLFQLSDAVKNMMKPDIHRHERDGWEDYADKIVTIVEGMK